LICLVVQLQSKCALKQAYEFKFEESKFFLNVPTQQLALSDAFPSLRQWRPAQQQHQSTRYIERKKSTCRKGAHEPLARSRADRIQMQEVDLQVDCVAGCGIAEIIPRRGRPAARDREERGNGSAATAPTRGQSGQGNKSIPLQMREVDLRVDCTAGCTTA